jgi:GT2 family glycosyltransferase
MTAPSQPSVPRVSVVLCAHEPRLHHFRATLDGLRRQDLPFRDWELLVVDNASSPPLEVPGGLRWHPRARLIREPTLGLAHARARAYRESVGDLIVHSDDDTVLATNYLRMALNLARERPGVGAFGGQLLPRFDRAPRSALERSFGGERLVPRDVWSHTLDDASTMPFGAGMCLRREVVNSYLEAVARDPRRLQLGRTGKRFITGEDIDLNHVAVQQGYATGLFRALRLVHLIPVERMTEEHVINYRAGNAYSMVVLWFLHTGEIRVPAWTARDRWRHWARLWLRLGRHQRRMEQALQAARRQAVQDLKAWGWAP